MDIRDDEDDQGARLQALQMDAFSDEEADAMVEELKEIGEDGRTDKWMDHIAITITITSPSTRQSSSWLLLQLRSYRD